MTSSWGPGPWWGGPHPTGGIHWTCLTTFPENPKGLKLGMLLWSYRALPSWLSNVIHTTMFGICKIFFKCFWVSYKKISSYNSEFFLGTHNSGGINEILQDIKPELLFCSCSSKFTSHNSAFFRGYILQIYNFFSEFTFTSLNSVFCLFSPQNKEGNCDFLSHNSDFFMQLWIYITQHWLFAQSLYLNSLNCEI